ncbi:MAG: LuxR C-terminal-related transcriptional regulator [Chloroflexota bacterium]
MTASLLTTKLFIPSTRSEIVPRPRLNERLDEGLHRKLTLISAPAGFGKTTLVTEWLDNLQGDVKNETQAKNKIAWLSLDKRDSASTRFLTYLVAALQTLAPNIGEGVLGMLQSPQPPSAETILTTLLNEITTISDNFTLVLDDYHVIDAKAVDDALAYLLEYLPPQMHLIITTREDPQIPLARLRARGQLTELRAADLRFTRSEAAAFLNHGMELNLSKEDISALETRTEGWIAGLQLAAISMQGQDTSSFIQSFTGSNRFVLDYLVEEVLQQQPENVQEFLLRTSILDRVCAPLCDALLLDADITGQETLEYLERTNLFIVPLDNERRWYRYHHLFADLLRHRLHQSTASSSGNKDRGEDELHIRASVWYEENGLEIEAFHHAVASNDIKHATRLMEGGGMPLHFRGAVTPVLSWLKSLPTTVLDAKPSLWVMYASALSMTGQMSGVEEKLQAAEKALHGTEQDDIARNTIGHIAAIRALLAASQHQTKTIIAQSQRALEYLHPDNLPVRTATIWKLGLAYQLQGDRTAASRAYTEAISISQTSGNTIINITASIGLGQVQETENQLHLAAKTYRRVLQLIGDQLQPAACEVYLGLARIFCEWNDVDTAQKHAHKSLQVAQQLEIIDRSVAIEVFLARLKLSQGDIDRAAATLAKAHQSVQQHNFVHHMPEVNAAQVFTLLKQGNLSEAAHLAEKHELPISQARVYLAQGDASAALAVLRPLRKQVEAKGEADKYLKIMILLACANHANDETDEAVQLLGEAMGLAEPNGFIRIFVDEGLPMAQLLSEAAAQGIMPNYVSKLLTVFEAEVQKNDLSPSQQLVDPLSEREIEILNLIAAGLKNKEIAEQLIISLNTVLYHIKNIYRKLGVNKRTLAIAKAKEIKII